MLIVTHIIDKNLYDKQLIYAECFLLQRYVSNTETKWLSQTPVKNELMNNKEYVGY